MGSPIQDYCQNMLVNLKQVFHIFITTILSLLLPLSFLLLARISAAHYLFSMDDQYPTPPSPSLIFFSLFETLPLTPLHLLVSLLTVTSLAHTFNGGGSGGTIFWWPRPRLYTAWILLCTVQVCVGLGIEGSIEAGVDGSGFSSGDGDYDRGLLCRVVFFLGLHATTACWWRTVVKPVVDDTMYGVEVEEGWAERVAMGVSFGGMWWWRLRDEVEALAVVAEVKAEMEVADFVGWWLYYLVVTVGFVRVARGVVWFGMVLLFRKIKGTRDDEKSLRVEEKV